MSKQSDDSMLFPQKLMDILADPLNQGTISWLPDGKSFVIRDRTLFAEIVMPRYFPRKAKYSSFTRKLNRWNFMRVANGPEPGAYFHKYFLRDQPQLAAQMFCKNARTMLAMSSNPLVAIPNAVKTHEVAAVIPVKQTPSAASTTEAASKFPLMTSVMWSMKTKPNNDLQLDKCQFGTSFVSNINSKGAIPDQQVLLMQQEKEQLNRMLIERALRLQQRSNVVMQQDRLLQMRRMIEMNMHQHRLQQQQKVVRQPHGGSDGTTRLVMNNRASAA